MSLIGNPHPDQTFTLASGLTLTGYQVVALDSTGEFQCKMPDGTSFPIGVAQLDDKITLQGPAAITVRTSGVSKAIAAKAFSVGAQLAPTTDGLVTDTAPATGRWFVGVALQAASQLGDEVLIFVKQELNEA